MSVDSAMAMTAPLGAAPGSRPQGWWRKDDWWAVAIGLGLVLVGLGLYARGSSLDWIAVTPAKWSTFPDLSRDFAAKIPRYFCQAALWLALSSAAFKGLGYSLRNTLPAVVLLYCASLLIFICGQSVQAVRYNLEPPLLALGLGLVLANLNVLPRRFDEGFRVEFFIKVGVVLLGATLPLSLIVWAGPIALLQAGIVSIITFGVIYAAARALKIEPRFAATLGAGGAVCGVSAAIAIAAAVGARKQDAATVIAIVVLWAIVMIFALPFAALGLHLPAAVGGAWIGTSEFADAAGLAAAQAFGHMAASASGAAPAAGDVSVTAFTLMKVIGRDVWIGIWALGLSLLAASRWDAIGVETPTGPAEIWRRFPKFVLGFLAASLLVTLVAQSLGHAGYSKSADPHLVTPLKSLRTWAFAFGFLSIGLTTRVRELSGVVGRPLLAFTAGVGVNVLLGLALSAGLFRSYWEALAR